GSSLGEEQTPASHSLELESRVDLAKLPEKFPSAVGVGQIAAGPSRGGADLRTFFNSRSGKMVEVDLGSKDAKSGRVTN
ncbi:MAG: hypothetical protein RL696_598, partial [Actinomycetota bacterium]